MSRIVGRALTALGYEIRLATLSLKLDVLIARLERRYRPDQPRAPKGTPEGGQWIDDLSRVGMVQPTPTEQRIHVAWMPTGFTKHGINQTINRGVPAQDVLDALNNPIKILPGSSPHSWRYQGAKAVVVINSFGEVITLWPR